MSFVTLVKRNILSVCMLTIALTMHSPTAQADDDVVRFAVEPTKTEYASDEAVLVTFRLTNISQQELRVNARFLVNYHFYSEQEVVITLLGPDDAPLRLIPVVDAGTPSSDQFILLKPGEGTEKEYSLSGSFDLSAKGAYRLSANYTNRYEDAWIGTAQSAEVTFDVQ